MDPSDIDIQIQQILIQQQKREQGGHVEKPVVSTAFQRRKKRKVVTDSNENQKPVAAVPEPWSVVEFLYTTAHAPWHLDCHACVESPSVSFIPVVDPKLHLELEHLKMQFGSVKKQYATMASAKYKPQRASDDPEVRPHRTFETQLERAFPDVKFCDRSAFRLLDMDAQTDGALLGHLVDLQKDDKNRIVTALDLCGGPGSYIQVLDYVFGGTHCNVFGLTLPKGDEHPGYMHDHWTSDFALQAKPLAFCAMYGDITDPQVIQQFQAQWKHRDVQLVLADGSFNCSSIRSDQETATFPLLLAQLFAACSSSSGGHSFMIRVFDITHPATIGALFHAARVFRRLVVQKSIATNPGSSEKSVVLIDSKPTSDPIRQQSIQALSRALVHLRTTLAKRVGHAPIPCVDLPTVQEVQSCVDLLPCRSVMFYEFWCKVNAAIIPQQIDALKRMVYVCSRRAAAVVAAAAPIRRPVDWIDKWVRKRVTAITDLMASYRQILVATFATVRPCLSDATVDGLVVKTLDWTQIRAKPLVYACLIPRGAILGTYCCVREDAGDVKSSHDRGVKIRVKSRICGAFCYHDDVAGWVRSYSKSPQWAAQLVGWLEKHTAPGLWWDVAIDKKAKQIFIVDTWQLPQKGTLHDLSYEQRREWTQKQLEVWIGLHQEAKVQGWKIQMAERLSPAVSDHHNPIRCLAEFISDDSDSDSSSFPMKSIPDVVFGPVQRNTEEETKEMDEQSQQTGVRPFQMTHTFYRSKQYICPFPCCWSLL